MWNLQLTQKVGLLCRMPNEAVCLFGLFGGTPHNVGVGERCGKRIVFIKGI